MKVFLFFFFVILNINFVKNLFFRGYGVFIECRYLIKFLFLRVFNIFFSIFVMIFMFVVIYVESVSSMLILERVDFTGFILNGIINIVLFVI